MPPTEKKNIDSSIQQQETGRSTHNGKQNINRKNLEILLPKKIGNNNMALGAGVNVRVCELEAPCSSPC